MISILDIDLFEYAIVNNLWPLFVDKLGLNVGRKAVQEAIDLQYMQGNSNTRPVIIFETCGLALVDIELINKCTGIDFENDSIVLILSIKKKVLQVLKESSY